MSENRITPEQTVESTLAKWDAGESVWTIELGGLGPGYEQCIQIVLMELLRDGDAESEAALARCKGMGLSGAQVGAARSLAAYVLKNGWAKAFAEVDDDRKIQVSRDFPQAPTVQAQP